MGKKQKGATGERPFLRQEEIRSAFSIGQDVLVRDGTAWHTRRIIGITVLRHRALCPHCGMPLLGEPRFWFADYGNIPLSEIMAKEDIDPLPPHEGPLILYPEVKEEL